MQSHQSPINPLAPGPGLPPMGITEMGEPEPVPVPPRFAPGPKSGPSSLANPLEPISAHPGRPTPVTYHHQSQFPNTDEPLEPISAQIHPLPPEPISISRQIPAEPALVEHVMDAP